MNPVPDLTLIHGEPDHDLQQLLAQLAEHFHIGPANQKVTLELIYRHGRCTIANRHETTRLTTTSDG